MRRRALDLFDKVAVDRCNKSPSCNLDVLLAGDPISIYIIGWAYRMGAPKPLLRVIMSSLLTFLFVRDESPAQRTLMLVGEVYQLGRLDASLVASTLGREYSLTLHVILQNAAQFGIHDSQACTTPFSVTRMSHIEMLVGKVLLQADDDVQASGVGRYVEAHAANGRVWERNEDRLIGTKLRFDLPQFGVQTLPLLQQL